MNIESAHQGGLVKTAFPHQDFARSSLQQLAGRNYIDHRDVQELLQQNVDFEIKQALTDLVDQLVAVYKNGQYLGLNCVQAYYSVQLLVVANFALDLKHNKVKALREDILRETGSCLEQMAVILGTPSSSADTAFEKITGLEKSWRHKVFDANGRWSELFNDIPLDRDWLSCESLKSVLVSLASVDIQMVPLYKHAMNLNYNIDLTPLFQARVALLSNMHEFMFSDKLSHKALKAMGRAITRELMLVGHIQQCLLSVNKHYKNIGE